MNSKLIQHKIMQNQALIIVLAHRG